MQATDTLPCASVAARLQWQGCSVTDVFSLSRPRRTTACCGSRFRPHRLLSVSQTLPSLLRPLCWRLRSTFSGPSLDFPFPEWLPNRPSVAGLASVGPRGSGLPPPARGSVERRTPKRLFWQLLPSHSHLHTWSVRASIVAVTKLVLYKWPPRCLACGDRAPGTRVWFGCRDVRTGGTATTPRTKAAHFHPSTGAS